MKMGFINESQILNSKRSNVRYHRSISRSRKEKPSITEIANIHIKHREIDYSKPVLFIEPKKRIIIRKELKLEISNRIKNKDLQILKKGFEDEKRNIEKVHYSFSNLPFIHNKDPYNSLLPDRDSSSINYDQLKNFLSSRSFQNKYRTSLNKLSNTTINGIKIKKGKNKRQIIFEDIRLKKRPKNMLLMDINQPHNLYLNEEYKELMRESPSPTKSQFKNHPKIKIEKKIIPLNEVVRRNNKINLKQNLSNQTSSKKNIKEASNDSNFPKEYDLKINKLGPRKYINQRKKYNLKNKKNLLNEYDSNSISSVNKSISKQNNTIDELFNNNNNNNNNNDKNNNNNDKISMNTLNTNEIIMSKNQGPNLNIDNNNKIIDSKKYTKSEDINYGFKNKNNLQNYSGNYENFYLGNNFKIDLQSKSISEEEQIRNINIRKFLIAPYFDYSKYFVYNLPNIIPRSKEIIFKKSSISSNKSMDLKINSKIREKSITNEISFPDSLQNIILYPKRNKRHC